MVSRYHETSAATAQNVEVAFQEIARRALKQEHTEDPMWCRPVWRSLTCHKLTIKDR